MCKFSIVWPGGATLTTVNDRELIGGMRLLTPTYHIYIINIYKGEIRGKVSYITEYYVVDWLLVC